MNATRTGFVIVLYCISKQLGYALTEQDCDDLHCWLLSTGRATLHRGRISFELLREPQMRNLICDWIYESC